MDSYTQALDEPERQAQKAPGRPDHANRKGGSSRVIVMGKSPLISVSC